MDKFVVTTAIRKLSRLKKRKKVVQGGTSAGKTVGILPLLINRCINEDGLEVSVVSESIPHLRRGAMKDFLKIMMITNRFLDKNWNASLLKYTFSNGSYIEFFSVDQDDRVRGARRNVLYVNEANNISFETYQQLAIRTSGDIWIDYNPTYNFWAHTELIGKDDVDFIILTYLDNEALPETIVKDIESAKEKAKTSNYWKNWWQVYGLGLTGNLEGAVIADWKEIDRVPNEARLLGYGMDFGYSNDPTTLIACYKYNNAYIFDEVIYKKGMLNNDINNLLKFYGVKEIIYADSADPKSIAELRAYGNMVHPVEKIKDSIMYGLSLLNENEIYVTSNSKNLINELRNYLWMKDKEGNKINKPIDAFNHAIDAMRYVLMMLLKNKNKGVYHIW